MIEIVREHGQTKVFTESGEEITGIIALEYREEVGSASVATIQVYARLKDMNQVFKQLLIGEKSCNGKS